MGQKEFATHLGVSFRTYQKYEMGSVAPGAEAIEAFIRTGINANWLLTGHGPMLAKDLRPIEELFSPEGLRETQELVRNVQAAAEAQSHQPHPPLFDKPPDSVIKARLEQIQEALFATDVDVPASPQWLAEHPEFSLYKEALDRIASGDEASTQQKTHANAMLRDFYGDAAGTARHKHQEFNALLRFATTSKAIARLGKELNYQAPMAWASLVSELMSAHGLTEYGARRIFETLRDLDEPK